MSSGSPLGAQGVEIGVFALASAAVLLASLAAGILDQDSAHGLGGGGEEVAAIGPDAVAVARVAIVAGLDEPQVGLVDERGRVEGLAGLFVGELLRRELSELVVDQRQQLAGRERLAAIDRLQNPGDLVHRDPTFDSDSSSAFVGVFRLLHRDRRSGFFLVRPNSVDRAPGVTPPFLV